MGDLFSAEGWFNTTLASVGDAIWTYILIGVLVAGALWFTVRSKGLQFRHLGEMFRVLGRRRPELVLPYVELLRRISETDENRVVRIHCLGAVRAASR